MFINTKNYVIFKGISRSNKEFPTNEDRYEETHMAGGAKN